MVYGILLPGWSVYLTWVGVLLLGYWASVGVAFYRKEIVELLSRSKTPGWAGNDINIDSPFEMPEPTGERAGGYPNDESPTLATASADVESGEKKSLFPVLYALSEEIRQFIQQAGKRKLVREELVQGLRSMMRQGSYGELREAGFQEPINNLVRLEAEQRCSILLDEGELKTIWQL